MLNNFSNLIASHKESAINAKKYIERHIDLLSGTEIGCSFNREHWRFKGDYNPFDCLEYIRQDLKIDQIRLAVRWDMVDRNRSIDFSYYRKDLEYCFNTNSKVTLNLGPIKGMRWPEEHVPRELVSLIKHHDYITLQHDITPFALDYLSRICDFIRCEYPNHMDKIKVVQGDNEVFNRFGEYGLTFSNDFELAVNRILMEKFPNAKILVNSNGLNDLNKIYQLLSGSDLSRFVIGINYYYQVPPQYKIPLLNKMDGLILSKPGSLSAEEFKEITDLTGHIVEVSELQGEPWGDANLPGNNYKAFWFSLFRSQYMRPKNQPKFLIRYWGIEELVYPFLMKEEPFEKKDIADMIVRINNEG